MNTVHNRLREIFEKTISTNLRYNGDVGDIDYFNLYCKAASKNAVYKILGSNFFMFNYLYDKKESILMIFSIPINSESGTKHIAERVMEIIENTESCFITLDYSNSIEVKEEKFVYVTIVKKYDDSLLRCFQRDAISTKPNKGKKKGEKVEPKKSENNSKSCPKEGS